MSEPLFHGTDKTSKDDIINHGIKLDINPRGGDFAIGFYLTPELRSASKMALRKSFNSMQPSVVELTLKKDYKNLCSIKDFGCITNSSPDEVIISWAQFIINNRNGIEYIRSVSASQGYEDNNLDKRYDIVIGTIADGSVTQIARRCRAEKRIVTIKEAKDFLDISLGMQYCICTEVGLQMIDKPPREKKGVLWR